MEGFWDKPVSLTMDYDSSGYYAVRQERPSDFADAMVYLYADPNEAESNLTLELDYGEFCLYFY